MKTLFTAEAISKDGRSGSLQSPDQLLNIKLGNPLADHVCKLIELTGTSATSIADAVDRALQRAHKTIKNLCRFQVTDTRGNIEKGKVRHWQVTIKVGFSVEN